MMHTKTILWSLGALLLAACSGGDQAMLDVHVDGGAGRTLYLDRYENNRPVHLDSVTLDAQGKGSLSIASLPLDFYRVAFDDQDQLVLALDSTSSVSVQATVGDMPATAQASGNTHSELLLDFVRRSDALQQEAQGIRERLANGDQDPDDLDRLNALNDQLMTLAKEAVDQNPGSPVQYYAVTRLNAQDHVDRYVKVRDDLRGTMAGSPIYQGYSNAVDRMVKQAEALRQQQERQQQLEQLLPIGGDAPDFAQQTPNGGTLRLSDLRGKLVLIDFWASWCKPCRLENPNVKRVYDRYHAKGFEILGVSLDRNRDAWLQAIEQDGLPWKHVSDLAFWNNEAAQLYGVSSIPYTVLVDREGKILAKGLRGNGLEQKLAEVLGS
ncbi:MAG TPA: TlpA disulfide reductase family protein [Flavobacteriales bacterium]|nr:TlpA disulfide reductase family protein [Flavobacteriales bacterium]